jgi:polyisoprenoid-binding protein YceI
VARYDVIPDLSSVSIAGTSTLHPITANATGLTGWLEAAVVDGGFASADLAGHVEIDVTRLASGNPLVDRETRRRIDAKRFPVITGEMTSVEQVEGPLATVWGVISFRGEQMEVQGSFAINQQTDGHLRLHGAAVFDVRWWGLEPPKLLALRVHPEITVTVELVLEAAG